MVSKIGGRKIKDKDIFRNFILTTEKLIMKPFDKLNWLEHPLFTSEMMEFWKNKPKKVTIDLEILDEFEDGIIRLIEDDGQWNYNLSWFELPDYLFE